MVLVSLQKVKEQRLDSKKHEEHAIPYYHLKLSEFMKMIDKEDKPEYNQFRYHANEFLSKLEVRYGREL